jgi:hypothetical protein
LAQSMERSLIYRIARAVDPDRPIVWLAELAGVAYSTAKTWAYGSKRHWAYGQRKPPVSLLKDLHAALEAALPAHQGYRLVLALTSLLDQYIWEREREPIKPRAGFNLIRERDGPGSIPRDGRNRRGRPPLPEVVNSRRKG